MLVQDAERTARGPGLLVRRQELAARFAPVVLPQVAHRRRRLQAALGHVARRNGHVAIRRDVPVVGRLQFQSVGHRAAEGRGQKAGLAPVIERKRQSRHIENLLPQKNQSRVVRLADVTAVVELELADFHEPVVVARPASRVCRVRRPITFRPEKFKAGGTATRAVVGKQVFGGQEVTSTLVDAQLELGPGEQVAASQYPHVAAGFELVVKVHVGDGIGLYHRVLLAQLGVAFDAGHAAGVA